MLVHTSLRTGKEPQHSLDYKVGNKPAQAASSYSMVDVGRLKEVSDEPIDGQSALELSSEDFETGECLGKGEEASSKAHGDGFGVCFDGFVRNVYTR